MTNEQIRALAEQVLWDRLRRFVVIGTTKSGRIITEPRGEPTAAEQEWTALCQSIRTGTA